MDSIFSYITVHSVCRPKVSAGQKKFNEAMADVEELTKMSESVQKDISECEHPFNELESSKLLQEMIQRKIEKYIISDIIINKIPNSELETLQEVYFNIFFRIYKFILICFRYKAQANQIQRQPTISDRLRAIILDWFCDFRLKAKHLYTFMRFKEEGIRKTCKCSNIYFF
jgi:hypothetical protein